MNIFFPFMGYVAKIAGQMYSWKVKNQQKSRVLRRNTVGCLFLKHWYIYEKTTIKMKYDYGG